jgi:hypothetical protein
MAQEMKPAIARQRPISTVCQEYVNGHLAKYGVTYRECEATGFDGRVTEKDEENVKGRIRETETGSRQGNGTYDGHREKHPETVWCRFWFLIFLGDRLC